MAMSRDTVTVMLRQHLDIFLCLGCVVFFLSLPKLDLWIAAQFYDDSFYLKTNPLVKAIYHFFAKIHIFVLFLLIGLLIHYSAKQHKVKKCINLYLLCCLLVGPGLLVNVVLKDNSLGRPRPVHIEEFGGNMSYTPPFKYSGACSKNCSFVSGHVSIGFYLMALFWVGRSRKWLFFGIALGVIIGFTRMMQGGHFLSDVIFAGWTVYFTCLMLAKLFKLKLLH